MTEISKIRHLKIVRTWYFWIAFLFISALCCYFNCVYLPNMYPILTTTITTDKTDIEQLSQDLCKKYDLGPENFSQISHFVTDKNLENFVEHLAPLTINRKIISGYLKTNLCEIYTWQVRHFKEGNPNECLLKFTSEGIPYGFIEHIPETEPGPSLTLDEALAIAKNFADKEWHINLEHYHLSETSQEERSNGRADYTFIFDRKKESSIGELNLLVGPEISKKDGISTVIEAINKITYKLVMCVHGSKVTSLDHLVEIPELDSIDCQGHFARTFKLWDEAFEPVANLFIYLFYIIICFVGLVILIKTNYLVRSPALLWGILLSLAHFLFQLSTLSDIWLNYNTSQSSSAYLINNILGYCIGFLFYSIAYTIIIMVAEGLTRKAFPKHIQLWKSCNKEVGSSLTSIGLVLSSYLFAIIYLATIVTFYVVSQKLLGLTPTHIIPIDSAIIGHFSPGLSVLTKSLYESFWQGMVFRAIPLALFTLIGQKMGIRKIGFILALIIQTSIMIVATRSYLALSGYIGFIQPVISSFFFGFLYINFGLLPTLIIPFVYTTLLMSLPLYNVIADSLVLQKLIIMVGIVMPVIALFINLIRTRKISGVSEKYLNASWIPIQRPYRSIEQEQTPIFTLSTSKIVSLTAFTILSSALIYKSISFNKAERKFEITRDQAIEKAKEFITSKQIFLDSNWELLSKIIMPNTLVIKYIWQNFGEDIYKKLDGIYIKDPLLEIKFAKFQGSGSYRAEEYSIRIDKTGKVASCRHTLPEDAPGAHLSENNANHLALSVASQQYNLNPLFLQVISSLEIKRPLRRDWIIKIHDTSIDFIGDAEAHIVIKICGDEVTSINGKIHTPKEWLYQNNKLDQYSLIFELLKELLLFLIILIAFFQLLQITKSKSTIITSIILWLVYLGLIITNTLLSMPEITAYLSTAKSFYSQVIYLEFITLAKEIVKSLSILILSLNIFNKKNRIHHSLKSLSLMSVSLGIIASGLSMALVVLYKNVPIIYTITYLNSYNYKSSFIITNLILYISRTLTIQFIAQYAKFNLSLKTIFAVAAIALLIMPEFQVKDLYTHVLIFCIIFILILIAHLMVIRYNTLIIPIILLIMQITKLSQEYRADRFLEAKPIILITISVLIITASLLTFLMPRSSSDN